MVKPGSTLRTLIFVVLLIVLAFLLLACGEEETPIAPTVTPTPTNYRTPIQAGIPTATATATATKRPAITPLPTSTATPTQTPFMIPTLGVIHEPGAYELATPEAKQLFEVLMNVNIQWEDQNTLLGPEWKLLYFETLDISNETGSELGEYYGYELSSSEVFFNYYLGSFTRAQYPRDYPKLAHWAIGDYFLERPGLLVKNQADGPHTGYQEIRWFRSDIYPLYLGNEDDNEYLVVSSMDEDYLYFHLIRQDASGQMELVDSEPRIVDMQHMEYHNVMVRELTGDGQMDLVISQKDINRDILYYHVYRGTSTGFNQMSEFELSDVSTLTWKIEDTPVPVFQINISHPVQYELEICSWTETIEYTWEGGIEYRSPAGEGRPNTIACKFQEIGWTFRADDYYFDEIPNTVKIMEDIVENFTPTTTQEFEIQQFSRLKLAIYKSIQNRDDSARTYLRDFIQQYKESEFGNEVSAQAVSDALQPLLEMDNIDVLPLCLAIYELEIEDFPGWNEFRLDRLYQFDMYDICPISHVVSEILADMPVTAGTPLLEKLNDAGLPAIAAEPYQLPGIEQVSWFVVFDMGWSPVWGYIPVDAQFEWTNLYLFHQTDPVMAYRGDGNGDGQEDLAFAGLVDEPYTECNSDLNSMNIFMISSMDTNNVWYGYSHACLPDKETYRFEDVFVDQNGDSLMDLILDIIDPWNWGRIMEAIDEDEVVLYDSWEMGKLQNDPNSWISRYHNLVRTFWDDANYSTKRAGLLQLLENPPEDDPYLYLYLQHINYLIAMTYELEGNDEQAIRYYLEVMNSQPQTLWANLAAAHLRLKE